MTTILRARVLSYTSATHTATVAPLVGPAAAFSVPVASFCRGGLLHTDDVVLVAQLDDNTMVVLGPTDVPDIPSGVAFSTNTQNFTAAAYADITATVQSITLFETSSLWLALCCTVSGNAAKSPAAQIGVRVGATLQNPRDAVGIHATGVIQNYALVFRTEGTFAPGTYEIAGQVYSYAVETITIGGAMLSALAIPSLPR